MWGLATLVRLLMLLAPLPTPVRCTPCTPATPKSPPCASRCCYAFRPSAAPGYEGDPAADVSHCGLRGAHARIGHRHAHRKAPTRGSVPGLLCYLKLQPVCSPGSRRLSHQMPQYMSGDTYNPGLTTPWGLHLGCGSIHMVLRLLTFGIG